MAGGRGLGARRSRGVDVSARAIVVGAGIGGLASAVALSRAGCEVTVLERAPEPKPLGAGLSLWPNGVRALRALGLGEVGEGGGVLRSTGALRRADGSELAHFDPAVIQARFGAPLVGVHRADLLAALLEAAGPDRVSWGAEVTGVEGSSVELAGGVVEAADLLVGADGIDSVVRRAIVGDGPPRDSGLIAWRGVVEASALVGAVPAGEWWGPRVVAGLLPLSGGRTYWYLAYEGEGGDRAELERRAAAFSEPLPEIIAATDPDAVLCHPLADRDPISSWSAGPSTLLGDAAHPMLPFLGQGACAALEDAVALGAAVSAKDGIRAAVSSYESERAPRAAALVKGSRQAGRVALAGSRPARLLRDALVSGLPASVRLRQLDRVVGRAAAVDRDDRPA